MAEALKNKINKKYVETIAKHLAESNKKFEVTTFLKTTLTKDWNQLELKQRLTRIRESLHRSLPQSYPDAVKSLMEVAPHFSGFEALFFPEYVASYGQEKGHKKLSRKALIHFTQYSSSELAVRPFIEQDLQDTMAWMLKLSTHKNYHVRRLASEGCRPRLPWAPALKDLKKDPSLIFPILENLKDDPELYVRKSVANNLNDISKDHPNKAIEMAKRWTKNKPSPHTQWIVRHGLRTLIKKGDKKALQILGYRPEASLNIKNFRLKKKKISLGETLQFSFDLENSSSKPQAYMIDFVIDHLKKNGQHQPKVFKLKKVQLAPHSSQSLTKSHSIKPISTREYYQGTHFLSLQINGTLTEKKAFHLKI